MKTMMRAPDYLATLETETIRRAYSENGLSYTRAGDAAAAATLERIAAVYAGVTVEIPASTPGRERSSRGLVAFKSPRGGAAPLAPPALAASQVELQLGSPEYDARTVERIAHALEQLERIGWALLKHLKAPEVHHHAQSTGIEGVTVGEPS